MDPHATIPTCRAWGCQRYINQAIPHLVWTVTSFFLLSMLSSLE